MSQSTKVNSICVIGGVDTHKDIHVTAVVNESNVVLSSESFPTTRHGYKQMLKWMCSFGKLSRVGIECSGVSVCPITPTV